MRLLDLLGERWCQGSFARDSSGDPIHCMRSEAKTFCILGGLTKLGKCNGVTLDKLSAAIKGTGRNDVISNVNDASTWEEVKEVITNL